MKRGFTLVELLIGIAVVAIILVVIGAYVFKCDVIGGDPGKTEQADRGVLPGKVNVVCIEGYEYYYVQSKWEQSSRAGLAPKWDREGRPAKCNAER